MHPYAQYYLPHRVVAREEIHVEILYLGWGILLLVSSLTKSDGVYEKCR